MIDKAKLKSADRALSAEMLRIKYTPIATGEHPVLTKEIWKAAIMNNTTLLGYWEWVQSSIFETFNPL